MTPPPEIRRARPGDLPAVLALLKEARLPTSDIASTDQPQLWVLEAGAGIIVGAIGLERFGSEALLRSLVIAPRYRNLGLARLLVTRVEESARKLRIERLVLLTETAERFFRALGYGSVDRAEVSQGLRQSPEFRSLCPASAACLSKRLPIP